MILVAGAGMKMQGAARMHIIRPEAGTAEKALAYLPSSPPRWLLWGHEDAFTRLRLNARCRFREALFYR